MAVGRKKILPVMDGIMQDYLEVPSGSYVTGGGTYALLGTFTAPILMVVKGQQDVKIDNVILDGKLKDNIGKFGLLIRNSSEVVVRDVVFRNFWGAGVVVMGGGRVVFERCIFENNSMAVAINHMPLNFDGEVLGFGYVDRIEFYGCEFYNDLSVLASANVKAYNLLYSRMVENLVIDGCYFEGAGFGAANDAALGTWGNGIYVWQSRNVGIHNVKSKENYWSSVVIGQEADSVVITDSFLSKGLNSSAALWIEQAGCRQVVVSSNQINGGVSMGDNGGQKVIFSKNIVNNPNYGLDISTYALDVVISNNIISGDGYQINSKGMYVYNHKNPSSRQTVIITSNIVSGYEAGIYLNNDYAVGDLYNLIITNNFCEDNTYPFVVGGDVQFTESVVIANNSFTHYYRNY
jgi:hypothetical protein